MGCGSSRQSHGDLHRVRDLPVSFPLLACGVDFRLGWSVLSEGIFLPTNLDLLALRCAKGAHEGIFLPADHDHLARRSANGVHERILSSSRP